MCRNRTATRSWLFPLLLTRLWKHLTVNLIGPALLIKTQILLPASMDKNQTEVRPWIVQSRRKPRLNWIKRLDRALLCTEPHQHLVIQSMQAPGASKSRTRLVSLARSWVG
ncbi:hypothetical protein KC19_2G050100 [Ceratodon purpureus]|uniref:Uncharacterized protein n=1 Tax=Ceratodon purpureus TaxID=3225 RepID=A0A8T0IU90_CERPU|nr:hypothetical protein KC19_2G050100 [Ceratodon purpureus]